MKVKTNGNYIGENKCQFRTAFDRQSRLAWCTGENWLGICDVVTDDAAYGVGEGTDTSHGIYGIRSNRARQYRDDDKEPATENGGKWRRCRFDDFFHQTYSVKWKIPG